MFDVGDKVVCTEGARKGKHGIIRSVEFGGSFAVNFYNPFIGGHDCENRCTSGHGWWSDARFIEKEGDEREAVEDYRFQIGDRVECIVDNPDFNTDIVIGCLGTVCKEKEKSDDWIGVRWDNRIIGGHDCHHACEKGYGWMTPPDYIQLLNEDDFEANKEQFEAYITQYK